MHPHLHLHLHVFLQKLLPFEFFITPEQAAALPQKRKLRPNHIQNAGDFLHSSSCAAFPAEIILNVKNVGTE